MEFVQTKLPGVVLIRPKIYSDPRGFFFEGYHRENFVQNGIRENFVQDNYSRSVKSTLRGMHLQRPPRAQAKLVRALKGKIFDVAADVNPKSPTFGQWVGEILSDDNVCTMYVPSHYAHGFLVLSDGADVMYKCSDFYAPDLEESIRWDDPALAISWPIPPGAQPVLSPKDAAAPVLKR
jgi:dTDP-4-dehydrorhamnose 3,5-epimerase